MNTLSFCFPASPADLTVAQLTELIAVVHPGTVVQSFEVIKASSFGEGMVSTADRALLMLHYAANPASLPQQTMLKLQRDIGPIIKSIYINETRFYLQLSHECGITTPQALGGGYDTDSGAYGLLLEDLSLQGATFPNVTNNPDPVAHVSAVIEQLATLHARFWQSPRFATDLAWVESHLQGPVSELLAMSMPIVCGEELKQVAFKRDMIASVGMTLPQLIEGTKALQQHQATLPQTFVHGDTHLGNTYGLPGGRAGLIDWQLCVRGYGMHDVSYIINTGLPVAERRQHERALLQQYRDSLQRHGVSDVPSLDMLWQEHARAVIWQLYVGWLGVSHVNYGWEILTTNMQRVATAWRDLDTGKHIRQLFNQ
ncbi:MAG TPA: phosphotransferase [Pseudomonadales bacterium]|nr:phosphotransferase [Pseudomonadales bacterium]